LSATVGTYSFAGSDVALVYGGKIAFADAGSYLFSGSSVNFHITAAEFLTAEGLSIHAVFNGTIVFTHALDGEVASPCHLHPGDVSMRVALEGEVKTFPVLPGTILMRPSE
jgi:hypothetical protein